MKARMEKIFLIDSGHGGMLKNVYQTDSKIGKYHIFSNGEIAYEGVINRQIKKVVINKLEENSFKVVDVCPTELDLSLNTRCKIANSICEQYGIKNCLLISLHSNAGGGRGFEVWTTKGQTDSDQFASLLANTFGYFFPDIKIRTDYLDGDIDKEEDFYILKNVLCPAVLTEFLFFDNWEDWQILKKPETHLRFANMIVEFAKNIMLNLKI